MFRKLQLVVATCALAAGLTAVAQAAAGADSGSPQPAAGADAELALVGRPGASFERSIETHTLRVRYRELTAAARRLDVGLEHDLLSQAVVSRPELDSAIEDLEPMIEKARERELEFGSVAGVSQSTLDAIAACESSGDPTAVNAAGYYGKYQFDTGTWAAVGGSGNPAEASEAEQDYRAALLYSRAGSSPWPVCGQ